MTILTIGRESGVAKPRLAVYQNDKPIFFGMPGSVPMGVSRKHCRVSFEDAYNILIEDITDNNFMYINGLDCKRKQGVTIYDTIELGPSKYRLDLDSILKGVSRQQIFDISHLRPILEDYKNEKQAIKKSQTNLNILSRIQGLFSIGAMIVAVCLPEEYQKLRVIMYVAAGVLALLTAYMTIVLPGKNDRKSNVIEEKFREKYTCPNPLCGRFLGMTPYKELVKNRTCPYCRARFTE